MPHILTLTRLYPSTARPRYGIFVEERLRHLLAGGDITARVVAPVPWFPFTGGSFGEYAEFARTPRRDVRNGIPVEYPRYPVIPKVGMGVAPSLMAAALAPLLRRLMAQNPAIGLIDSHFLYPDGVAACLLGRWLGIPVLLTARGSDVNLYPRFRVPRAQIIWALGQAAHVVTVSEALRNELMTLGCAAGKVTTLRNGVDLARFRPRDRSAARRRLGLSGTVVLSVGNLLELKGHHLVIEAVAALPEVSALIVGEGPERPALERLVRERGLGGRVRLTGNVPQADLVDYYNAADLLMLASSREGMPNVVLESLACGTPVVATGVGGIPELVDSDTAGRIVPDRSAQALAGAVRSVLASPPDRAAVAEAGARFSWDPTIERLRALIGSVATSS